MFQQWAAELFTAIVFFLKKKKITIKNKLSNEMNEVTATRNICFYADELKEASMID